MKRIFTLFFLLSIIFTAKSQSTTVVISQIYGGGGATSGTPAYHDDYIELHNLSAAPVNLFATNAGNLPTWSIQYGSQNGNLGGGTGSRILIPYGVTIPAGGYYLIQITSTGATVVGPPLPVTADLILSGSPALSGTNGKLALLSDTTLLKCGQTTPTATPCTLPIAALVDLVGYGDLPESPTNFETFVVTGDSTKTVNGGKSLNSRVVAVRKNGGNQDTQNNNADFDTIPGAVPHTLPVKLNTFSVQKMNSIVQINWSTDQEFNSSHFIVERSNNGNSNWTAIATVTAAGNSDTKRNYSFTDNAPLKGLNYYRLRQVDIMGKAEFSLIRKLLFNTKYQLLVTPNPVRDMINLYVSKNNNELLKIQLTDVNGKQVRTLQTNQASAQINAAGLTKGMYFIKVVDDNNVTTQKILLQ